MCVNAHKQGLLLPCWEPSQRWFLGGSNSCSGVKEGIILRNFAAILLAALTAIGPLPETKAQDVTPPIQIDLAPLSASTDIFQGTLEHKITIVVGESEYNKQQRLAAEEAARQATAKAAALAEATKKRAGVRYAVRGFYAGQCTAYVASRFPVTWHGNAKYWGSNARSQGYKVDKTPEAGAILQTVENSRGSQAGHVAYIDAIIDGVMYISEQNYVAWGTVSYRQLPLNSSLIAWVIHRR